MLAGILNPEDNNGVLVVVFCDEVTGGSLEIQAPMERGECCCLVVNGGPTFHGGLDGVQRQGRRLIFDLTEEAASVLGVDEHVTVDITPGEGGVTAETAERCVREILMTARAG